MRHLLNVLCQYTAYGVQRVKQLGLLRYHGTHAGRRLHRGTPPAPTTSLVTCPNVQGLPVQCVIIGNRMELHHQENSIQARVLVYFRRAQPSIPTKIWFLNAQSINNKFTTISDCITTNHFSFFMSPRFGMSLRTVQALSPAHRLGTPALSRPGGDELKTF